MSTMRKVTEFTVIGSGEFPMDMLRYDSCWPRDSSDAAAITSEGRREVRLFSAGYRTPTHGRWESFMWHVVPNTGR